MPRNRKQKKILIIDDDQTIAIILMEFLKNKSYQVVFKTDVTNVDDLLLEEKPDLIFLDYRMSPMTGKDILEKINLCDAPVPVIMMSAYRTREGMFEVKNLGAFDYISKPFDFSEIESILNKVFLSY